jgi:hypothetical protein
MKAHPKVDSMILILSFLQFETLMFLAILGTYEEINGIQTYVATPKTDFPKDKAILYITDVYGLDLNNNQVPRARPVPPPGHHANHNPLSSFPTTLLATASRSMPRSFSKAIPSPKTLLILCVVPCQLYVHLQGVFQGSSFNLQSWIPNHTPQHTGKRVRRLIDGLKEQGITIYGATGYCYGGTSFVRRRAVTLRLSLFVTARLVFDLAFDNVIQAAVVSHPSLLKPDDLDVRHRQTSSSHAC